MYLEGLGEEFYDPNDDEEEEDWTGETSGLESMGFNVQQVEAPPE